MQILINNLIKANDFQLLTTWYNSDTYTLRMSNLIQQIMPSIPQINYNTQIHITNAHQLISAYLNEIFKDKQCLFLDQISVINYSDYILDFYEYYNNCESKKKPLVKFIIDKILLGYSFDIEYINQSLYEIYYTINPNREDSNSVLDDFDGPIFISLTSSVSILLRYDSGEIIGGENYLEIYYNPNKNNIKIGEKIYDENEIENIISTQEEVIILDEISIELYQNSNDYKILHITNVTNIIHVFLELIFIELDNIHNCNENPVPYTWSAVEDFFTCPNNTNKSNNLLKILLKNNNNDPISLYSNICKTMFGITSSLSYWSDNFQHIIPPYQMHSELGIDFDQIKNPNVDNVDKMDYNTQQIYDLIQSMKEKASKDKNDKRKFNKSDANRFMQTIFVQDNIINGINAKKYNAVFIIPDGTITKLGQFIQDPDILTKITCNHIAINILKTAQGEVFKFIDDAFHNSKNNDTDINDYLENGKYLKKPYISTHSNPKIKIETKQFLNKRIISHIALLKKENS